MKYYFIAYSYRAKEGGDTHTSNELLEGVHPVIWFCNAPDKFKKHFESTLLFWEEIPKSVFIEAKESNCINSEI